MARESGRGKVEGCLRSYHPDPLTVAEVAERTGLSLLTARRHLIALVSEGLAGVVDLETGRRGRPPKGYYLL